MMHLSNENQNQVVPLRAVGGIDAPLAALGDKLIAKPFKVELADITHLGSVGIAKPNEKELNTALEQTVFFCAVAHRLAQMDHHLASQVVKGLVPKLQVSAQYSAEDVPAFERAIEDLYQSIGRSGHVKEIKDAIVEESHHWIALLEQLDDDLKGESQQRELINDRIRNAVQKFYVLLDCGTER